MTKYARAGGGNWNADATWSTTSGGGADTTVPTAGDDVVLDASSGNVTINVASVCRSLDCTGYTGTLTHNAGINLSIGDATAGAGNIALKLVAGMTYTLGNNATSAISFVSTSATQQTVDYGGKNGALATFNGLGGSWILVSDFTATFNGGTGIDLVAGSLDTNGYSVTSHGFRLTGTAVRSLSLGSSVLAMQANAGGLGVWNAATITNLTFDAGTSSITTSAVNQSFQGGGLTYHNVAIVGSGGGAQTLTGANTFNDLELRPANNNAVSVSANQTVNGTLTCTSADATTISIILSGTRNVAVTITATNAAVSNVNFRDITIAGACAPVSGTNIGNAGGNSGITFPAPVTRYWVATTGGSFNATSSWSETSGGASGASIPLPQDTAIFDSNSITSTGRTITINAVAVPTIDLTNVLNAPTIAQGIINATVYVVGDYILRSDLTVSGTTGITFAGLGNHVINTAGVTITNQVFIITHGTYTLQSALTVTANFNHVAGTFNSNGYNVTCNVFNTNYSTVRTLNMGSSTWTVTATGTVWNSANVSNLTLDAGTSTIVVSDTSATEKVLALNNGLQYNKLVIASLTTSTVGVVRFSLTANIRNLTVMGGNARLRFDTGMYVFDTFNVQGTSGCTVFIDTASAGNKVTFSVASGTVKCNYISLKDTTATGGATFIANASIDAGNNTGWTFTYCPVQLADTGERVMSIQRGGRSMKYIGGTSGQNISLPNTFDTIATNLSGVTVLVRQKVATTAFSRALFNRRAGSGSFRCFTLEGASTTLYRFFVENQAGTSATVNITPTFSAWETIGGSYDGATVRGYCNGKNVSSTALTGLIRNSTSQGTNIGSFDGGANSIDGNIKSVYVWNRALTGDEHLAFHFHGIVPRDGLVGEWDADNLSGTTIPDTSGQGNTATVSGAVASTDVPPYMTPVGGLMAIQDGSASVSYIANSRIDLPFQVTSYEKIAFFSRVYIPEVPTAERLLFSQVAAFSIKFAVNPGGVLRLAIPCVGGNMSVVTTKKITTGWHDVFAKYDGSTGKVTFVIDGVFFEEGTDAKGNVASSISGTLRIGENSSITHRGQYKHACIWKNTDITIDELKNLTYYGIVPYANDPTKLVLNLPMNEGAGDTVYDTSGNNNHGTITGATWSADLPPYMIAGGQLPPITTPLTPLTC
jgi:hypothetical protein